MEKSVFTRKLITKLKFNWPCCYKIQNQLKSTIKNVKMLDVPIGLTSSKYSFTKVRTHNPSKIRRSCLCKAKSSLNSECLRVIRELSFHRKHSMTLSTICDESVLFNTEELDRKDYWLFQRILAPRCLTLWITYKNLSIEK